MFNKLKMLYLFSAVSGIVCGSFTSMTNYKSNHVISETITEIIEEEQTEEPLEEVKVEEVVNIKKAYEIDEYDRELIIKLVYLEARGECYEGKKAVASIVLNRLDSGCWGDTVYDVIFAKGQFTPAGKINTTYILDNDTWNDCINAVDEVLLNGNIFPKYVLYFRSDYYFTWAKKYTNIGNHYFSYLQKDYDKFVDKASE